MNNLTESQKKFILWLIQDMHKNWMETSLMTNTDDVYYWFKEDAGGNKLSTWIMRLYSVLNDEIMISTEREMLNLILRERKAYVKEYTNLDTNAYVCYAIQVNHPFEVE